MEDIVLKSEKIEIIKISKKTKAMFFKDINIKDKLKITYIIKRLVKNKGNYAPTFNIFNLTQKTERKITPSQLLNLLKNFEYKVLEEW